MLVDRLKRPALAVFASLALVCASIATLAPAPAPAARANLAHGVSASFTAATDTATMDCYADSVAVFQVSGTYGGWQGIFEATADGTNWVTIRAARVDSGAAENTIAALTNTSRGWRIGVVGFQQVRLRSTALTSGTVSVRGVALPVGAPAEPMALADGTVPAPVGMYGAQAGGGSNPVYVSTIPFTSDAIAGGTYGGLQSDTYPHGYNGTTWDRLRSDNTGSLRASLYGKGTAAGDTAIPSLDTAAHRGYVTHTDGTNSMPAGDAQGRDIFTRLSTAAGLGTGTTPVIATLARNDGTVFDVFTMSADGQGAGVRGNVFAAVPHLLNGATLDRQRTPNVVKTATATAAGDTAVWTPAAGKKFRLMGYHVMVTGQATTAAGGNEEILLRDATTATGAGVSAYVPAVALNLFGGYSTGEIQLGNGLLSAAANNVLNVNLGTALTAGEVRVVVWGTEE